MSKTRTVSFDLASGLTRLVTLMVIGRDNSVAQEKGNHSDGRVLGTRTGTLSGRKGKQDRYRVWRIRLTPSESGPAPGIDKYRGWGRDVSLVSDNDSTMLSRKGDNKSGGNRPLFFLASSLHPCRLLHFLEEVKVVKGKIVERERVGRVVDCAIMTTGWSGFFVVPATFLPRELPRGWDTQPE